MDHSPKTEKFARVEDDALLRGRGRFVDDAACKAPGVIAVLTGPDVVKAGIASVARHPPIAAGRGSSPLVVPPRPALAVDRVMHVGNAVALVVAETMAAAQDAA